MIETGKQIIESIEALIMLGEFVKNEYLAQDIKRIQKEIKNGRS